MGWEQRGNRKYYYRKKRIGQLVKSEYAGPRSSADLFSYIDEEARTEHQFAEAKWKKEKAEIRKLEADLGGLDEAIRSLVRATLLISGYHPYKGQWRKVHHE